MPAMLPDDKICYCYNVPLRKLQSFARRTKPSRPSQMSECLGAGTGCGWCIPILKQIAADIASEGGGNDALTLTPEEYAEQALQYQADGWAAYKIHPPTVSAAGDIAVCRAVRAAVGDDYRIMLDSTWAYDYPDALRVGKVAEELNFYWYEDPLADDDMGNYVKLRQQLGIPLMATEYSPGGFGAYAPWLMAQATDYLRGDVAVKGGITGILKAAHLAEAFKMNYEIHHGGNSLNNVANLHITMAVPNCEFYEVFPCTGANKYGLVEDIEVDDKGLVYAPTRPGLGYDIDWDLVKREHTATAE